MDELRRRLMLHRKKSNVSEYTECQYIQNPSNAYIDTGVKPNNTLKMDITLESPTFEPWAMMFGTRILNESIGYFISYHAYKGWLMQQFGNGLSSTIQLDITNKKINLINESGNLFVDGASYSSPTSAYKLDLNIYLFGLNYGGNYDGGNTNLKIYRCKFFDNGKLIRDYVPMLQNSTGMYGMYDKVEEKFYTSPNNTKFVGM